MLHSINPYNGEKFASVKELTKASIQKKLNKAEKTFMKWRSTSFKERSGCMYTAAFDLRKNARSYAEIISLEMGKPITQAIAEVEKCAWVCDYYAENAEHQMQPEYRNTDAFKSYVSYEPIGVVLAVMPWNYPFWQVFRFAAPALMAGNIALLKHSSNVMKSAANIEKVFKNAGFPAGCFQYLAISSKPVESIIRSPVIKAVTLTGSKPAGSAVASVASEEIKKTVLELGGSNALVIFDDCDIDQAVESCVNARFQNTGQSCISGKRLLLQKGISEDFLYRFTEKVKKLKSGNPMDENTYIGVLAREDLAQDLESQVKRSVKMGAKLHLGGGRNKAWFEPTILTEVTPEMPVFKEETFGPAIGVTIFKTKDEAVKLVNSSVFGLGVSVFTKDIARAEHLVPRFDEGAVFINEMVKSDPRLPFGGTKTSGYGRELSEHGIREFLNRKTVFIK